MNLWSVFRDFQEEAVWLLIDSVVRAGEQIKKLDRVFEIKEGEGHRSGITKGDKLSQEIISEEISRGFPKAVVLSEEEGGVGNLLHRDRPSGILEAKFAFVIDPLDGTAPYGSDLGTWCVAGGVMRCGEIVGGVMYAPALNGGMLVASEPGKALVAEWEGQVVRELRIGSPTPSKKCVVAMGVDAVLYPSFTKFLPEVASNVRVVCLCNSGILGLAQVATGRIQAVIQTPQKAWDWVPAFRAVLEAGKTFQFFRIADGGIVALKENTFDFDAFCYKPSGSRLGFIAGEPELVRKLFGLLPKEGWAIMDPDTVMSNWK